MCIRDRCAIGINAKHYAEMGFDKMFAELTAARLITSPMLIDVAIYESADDAHAGDRGSVAMFQVVG